MSKFNVEILAHSKNGTGDELITFGVTFPRIILAEFNTHRMFSKNTSSSRAIPISRYIEAVNEYPFIPIAWQKSHRGMQGTDYLGESDTEKAVNAWLHARDRAISSAKALGERLDVTKQLANRILEPFMWVSMIVTTSREGLDNFFNLRCPRYMYKGSDVFYTKSDAKAWYPELESYSEMDWMKINLSEAEIHIQKLAEMMLDKVNLSDPVKLEDNEWHIPNLNNLTNMYPGLKVIDYAKIATVEAARTSYTIIDQNPLPLDRIMKIYEDLSKADPMHASPFEHCARAMDTYESKKFGNKSRNLTGFMQFRHLIEEDLI